MVSKTGFNSPPELEMTCSTSEVAVCCSSASEIVGAQPQLIEQPGVLDGEHGLACKRSNKCDLLDLKRSDLHAAYQNCSNGRTFA